MRTTGTRVYGFECQQHRADMAYAAIRRLNELRMNANDTLLDFLDRLELSNVSIFSSMLCSEVTLLVILKRK